jgi:phosphonoacetaldehyde hydrolase
MSEKEVRAVLFDWAGTVVDHGSWAPVAVFIDVFHLHGIELTLEQVRKPMGMAKRDHIKLIFEDPQVRAEWKLRHGEEPGFAAVDALYDDFLTNQEAAILDRSELLEGVAELSQSLVESGIQIGGTTGYPRNVVKGLIHRANEQGFTPACTITATDVPIGRPAPWMIFRACERLNVYPMEQVVNVDDTVAGVLSGVNAGCWSVGVSRTGNLVGLTEREYRELPEPERVRRVESAERKLREAGAHFVVDSVKELPDVLHQINVRLHEGWLPNGKPT